jgi:hypothetical protein
MSLISGVVDYMEINSQTPRQQLLRLLLSALVVVTSGFGIVTATSGAMFTDTSKVGMELSTGWVDIDTDSSELLALSNLKPGDTLYRSFNVANLGSLALSYVLTVDAPKGQNVALFDALQISTWRVNLAENCTASQHQVGTHLASSTLTNLSITNSHMSPGTAETLCFIISLPSSTAQDNSGKNTRVTINIASQQV